MPPVMSRDVENARPVKELKAFEKVELDIRQQSRVTVSLGFRDFSIWAEGDWIVPSGEYRITVGSSLSDQRLRASVFVKHSKISEERFTTEKKERAVSVQWV